MSSNPTVENTRAVSVTQAPQLPLPRWLFRESTRVSLRSLAPLLCQPLLLLQPLLLPLNQSHDFGLPQVKQQKKTYKETRGVACKEKGVRGRGGPTLQSRNQTKLATKPDCGCWPFLPVARHVGHEETWGSFDLPAVSEQDIVRYGRNKP